MKSTNNMDGTLNKIVENIVCIEKQGNMELLIHSWCFLISSYDKHDLNVKVDGYNYIKEELVRKGILEAEIAFIHDVNSDAKKDTLFEKMRTGVKMVLIGSTEKCEIGADMQTYLAVR